MESSSSVRRRSSHTQIIPGLPNEVGLTILLRLPRSLHGKLRRVCSAWRDSLQPSTVNPLRDSLRISEMWALFLFGDNSMALYDPLLQHLSSPIRHSCDQDPREDCVVRILGVAGSQVLFWHWQSTKRGFTFRYFDVVSMQWQADSIPRIDVANGCASASAVVDGHVYVVGGGEDGREAWRCDVKSGTWETMPMMHQGHARGTAVVLQGRVYVIGGHRRRQLNDEVRCCEVWDPRTGEWMLEPELYQVSDFRTLWETNVAVVMDTLYALIGMDLYCFMSESKLWTFLDHLPIFLPPPNHAMKNCRLVGAGGELWVVVNRIKHMLPEEDCTYKIFSCVPAIGASPLSWRSVPTNSSIKSGYEAALCTVYV